MTLYVHMGSLQLNGGAGVSALSAPWGGPYSGLFHWQPSSDGLYLEDAGVMEMCSVPRLPFGLGHLLNHHYSGFCVCSSSAARR